MDVLLDLNYDSIDFVSSHSSNPSPLSTATSPFHTHRGGAGEGNEINPRAFSPVKQRDLQPAFPRRQRRWSTTSATMINANIAQIYDESLAEVMQTTNASGVENEVDQSQEGNNLEVKEYNYESDNEDYLR